MQKLCVGAGICVIGNGSEPEWMRAEWSSRRGQTGDCESPDLQCPVQWPVAT